MVENVVMPPASSISPADQLVELRVLAEQDGDGALRRAFAEGGDVHREVAARIARVPIDLVTPEQRRAVKAIVFWTVYGSGPKAYGRPPGELRCGSVARGGRRLEGGALRRLPCHSGISTGPGRPGQAGRRPVVGHRTPAPGSPGKGRPDPLHGRGELRRPGERRRRAPGRGGQRPAGAARLDDPDRPRRARPGGREDRAEEAAAFLPASMGAAFSELFPGAPLNGLVEARVAQCWAHAK
jgi:DNA polymerase family A